MIDFRKDGHTLEPIWCLAHLCWAPCMHCLIPEVMKTIPIGHLKQNGIIFQALDLNRN